MEQFGLLEIYNNLNELSLTEQRLSDARDSLQLGDACLQSSLSVSLKGNIFVDSFVFDSNQKDSVGYYLNNADSNGAVTCTKFSLPDWLASKYQNEVALSAFDNDSYYVGIDDNRLLYFSDNQNLDHNTFIYDESFYGMKNRPDFQEVKNHFGYTGAFFTRSSNMEEMTDTLLVRSNLGLGDVSTRNMDYVYLDKVRTIESFTPQEYMKSNTFLRIDQNSKLRNEPFDFPYIRNDIPSSSVDLSNNIPSLVLLSNLTTFVGCNIDETARYNKEFMASNEQEIRELIYRETLFTADNFMSNTSEEQKSACREKLSFGSISTQSSNNVKVSSLKVSDIIGGNNLSGKVFYDENWMTAEDFRRAIVDSETPPNFQDLNDLFTIAKAADFKTTITSNLSNLENEANLSLEDFGGNLFRVDSNLEGLEDPFHARAVLDLHPCAITGRLKDLHRRPAYLSELENDVNYYRRNENFADVHPRFHEETRRNIGVSNMSLEDADNIGGTEALPLGVANRKFHSTDCVIDTVFAEQGKFILKSLDLTTEAGHDFLCVERFDRNVPGIKNFKYRYKPIDKCDEDFFTGTFRSDGIYNVDQAAFLRVKINDLTDTGLLDPFGNPVREDHIVADYFVPSCKFTYKKFVSIASNILHQLEIPVKYFEGGLDNIEYFNRQF